MALFNHEATCKKCKEKVLYTWRKCPYCNSRHFARQSNFFAIRRNIHVISLIVAFIPSVVFIFRLLYLASVENYYVKREDVLGLLLTMTLVLVILVLLLLLAGFVGRLLAFFIALFLFYIIQPFSHYFGKTVTILEVAKSCNHESLRIPAIKRLTDQCILNYIVKTDESVKARIAAVEQLTDQDELAFLAKNDTEAFVRKAAVEKIIDQSLLTDIAKKCIYSYIRLIAAEKLNDTNSCTKS